MGLAFIKASVINPANPHRKTRLEFLMDSGAIYSVVPQKRLKRRGRLNDRCRIPRSA